ncbi:MAG: hypothetical protein ACREM2_12585, partial [Vulcanimicrobiaceae bacterium]
EHNAIRLHDLLTEIGARIPELETQERRAKRYRKLSAKLRDFEILSYLRASATRRTERERLQAELERLDVERAGAAAKTATLEAELGALRSRLYAHEQVLEDQRAAATAARARLADRESQHSGMAARREALERQSLSITDDRERAESERTALAATIAELEAQLGPQTALLEAERRNEAIAQDRLATARAGLDRVFSELREVESAAAAAAATEAERRAQMQALVTERERLDDEARSLQRDAADRAELAQTRGEHARRLAEHVAELAERGTIATAAAIDAEARVGQAQTALTAAQATLRATTGELASAEARLHTIEELEANLEGHIPGTRAVHDAFARKELSGIVGVVSNLIRVEERYARALDIAFGAGLSNIVTRTAEDAERAITFLRGRELGRATFLPLDVLGSRTGRDPVNVPRVAGVVGWAHTLVETDAAYRGIVAFLVGRILIVESLDVGVGLVRPKSGEPFRDAIVTLDGDEIRGGGAMSGGRYARERAILSRQAQGRTIRERLPSLRAGHAAAE